MTTMIDDIYYTEKVSSDRTEALFVALTALFLLLLARRLNTGRRDKLAAVFGSLSGLFLFYSVNFRTLTIRLTAEALQLRFGIFNWTVPLENIAGCRLDDVPLLLRMGGAGIHFMSVRQRYRASFNFLEYPRVVIAFKRKVGPVRDISFSTRQPDEVVQLIEDLIPT